MALFSQDDSGEDETPGMGSIFSGGQEPQDPDAEGETPSPVEVDGKPLPVDSARAYARSADEHDSMLERQAPADYPFPLEQDSGEDAGQYAEPAAGDHAESERHWESVPQDSGSGAPQRAPGPQFVDNLPNYQALERQIASFNPNDYKPSLGRRIAAALSGGAVAFGSRNPLAGMEIADRVNDAPLNHARELEQQREGSTRQQIEDVNAENQSRQVQYRNQRVAANDAALNEQRHEHAQDFKAQADARANAIVQFTPKDPSNPYAGGSGVTASGKTVDNVAPPDSWLKSWERDPANKAKAQANAGVQTLHALEADGVKLTPEQRAIVASGGKVTPSVRTTVSILENPDGSARASGRGPQAPQGIQNLIAKSVQDKQAFIEQWQRQPDGSYMNPSTAATLTGPAFNARVEKFRTDLNANANMRKAGTWVDATGATRGPGEQGMERQPAPAATQQPAPQAAAPPPPQGQTFQYKGQTFHAGQTVNIDGKPAVVKGINPQTGKLIVGAQ